MPPPDVRVTPDGDARPGAHIFGSRRGQGCGWLVSVGLALAALAVGAAAVLALRRKTPT